MPLIGSLANWFVTTALGSFAMVLLAGGFAFALTALAYDVCTNGRASRIWLLVAILVQGLAAGAAWLALKVQGEPKAEKPNGKWM